MRLLIEDANSATLAGVYHGKRELKELLRSVFGLGGGGAEAVGEPWIRLPPRSHVPLRQRLVIGTLRRLGMLHHFKRVKQRVHDHCFLLVLAEHAPPQSPDERQSGHVADHPDRPAADNLIIMKRHAPRAV